jgi:hypothetical protein
MINHFHFSKYTLSFSKCSSFSKCAFVFRMEFFFKMCFRFQNVKTVCNVSWGFFHLSEKHNSKQKFVNKYLYSHFKELYWWGHVNNDEIYIKLSNLFQLSRIYNLLHPRHGVHETTLCIDMLKSSRRDQDFISSYSFLQKQSS